MNQPKTILVVEDDANIAFGLSEVLKAEGFLVITCARGDEAEHVAKQADPAIILLDVMLPGKNGFDICKALRRAGRQTPILMLTAKGQEIDKVIGLEAGADDYVTKPFGVRELVARIHALLRRAPDAAAADGAAAKAKPFRVGEAEIDPDKFEVTRSGETAAVTPKELALLQVFHKNRGRVLSRDRLLNEVWGINYYGTTRTLDQTVAQLRKKIGDNGGNPQFLLTVHGVGYKLAD
ncbi:MAG: response regulator transcription factor [Verrucomicrobiales bacterium]